MDLTDRLFYLTREERKRFLDTYRLVNKKSAMQLLRIYELSRQANSGKKHTPDKRSTK